MTNCVNCSKELKAGSINPESNYQFDNALWVGFFGGYGMFVDDIETDFGHKKPMLEGAAEEAVLCHDCAHELCEQVPWIKRLLRPEKAHSHSQEFWKTNPDHEGWDRDIALERLRKTLSEAKEDYDHD